MSDIYGAFCRAIFNITIRLEHIFPSTRIVHSQALCNRPLQARLSLFLKLAGSTTATNVGPPEGLLLGVDGSTCKFRHSESEPFYFFNCRAQPLPKFPFTRITITVRDANWR
jgi:hypothetical protein